MIQISDGAVRQLRILLASEGNAGEGRGLRLKVEKGGCAGLQYSMKLDTKREGDCVVSHGGVLVMIGEDSVSYLQGCELDYVDTLADSGFRVNNPNAIRSCGCGTSFEPASAASDPAPELQPTAGIV